MNELQTVEISKCFESPTNPRGARFEGKEFDELVASIKEKGVLMPILLRPQSSKFEVVAGNRRFRAAKVAMLTTLPARVVEMTDIEVREAQIVENLQRADVHPLEEGEAYRLLIEESAYDVAAVAAKVGKSESYVRDRLVLTNLIKTAKTAFRADDITAGAAALIARLNEKQQKDALREVTKSYGDITTTADLRSWIQERVLEDSMQSPPWHNDDEMKLALGGCEECKGKGGDLFGKKAADACTNPKCYATRLAAFVEMKLKSEPELVRLSGDYSNDKLPGRSKYKLVSGKKGCGYEQRGIIVEGDGLGSIVRFCMDSTCTKHWEAYERKSAGTYKPTAKEIASRKAAATKLKLKKQKEATDFQVALAKIQFPLSAKHLEALFELSLEDHGTFEQQQTVRLLGLEPVTKKEKGYSYSSDEPAKMRTVKDYKTTIRNYATDKNTMLRVIFALSMPTPDAYENRFAKSLKAL